MTCSLRETRPPAPDALAAQIASPNADIAHDARVARPARSTTRSTDLRAALADLVTVSSQCPGASADARGVPGWPIARTSSGLPGLRFERMAESRTLTTTVQREEDWYVAQCLEVDVASQGRTIDEALASLAEAVGLYLDEVDDPARYVSSTPLVTSFALPAA